MEVNGVKDSNLSDQAKDSVLPSVEELCNQSMEYNFPNTPRLFESKHPSFYFLFLDDRSRKLNTFKKY